MKSKLKIKGINTTIKKYGIVAGLSLSILASLTGCDDKSSLAGFSLESTKKPIEEKKELTKEEKLQKEIEDKVKNSEDVLPDMKTRYLEKYNKENKTEYKVENLRLVKAPTDYIIKTEDGIVYSHGETPDAILKELKKKGIEFKVKYNISLYKSLNENGILEQMLSNGTPVLDGNKIENIGTEVKKTTLSNFIDVFNIGLELKNDFTKENLQKYQQSIIKFYYEKRDKEKSNTNITKQKDDYERE